MTTGFVGRAAETDRTSASGIYLACYYVGGLAGSALPGILFERYGWPACIAATAAALALAALLDTVLRLPKPGARGAATSRDMTPTAENSHGRPAAFRS